MSPSPRSAASILAVIGLVAALAPGGAAGAAASQTTLCDPPTFDAKHNVITINFHGPDPKPILFTLAPDHHYIEVAPARLAGGGLINKLPGTDIKRYAMADKADHHAVRVAFELKHAATPAFEVDHAGHRMIIWPLGHTATRGSNNTGPSSKQSTKPGSKPSPKASGKPAPKASNKPAPRSSARSSQVHRETAGRMAIAPPYISPTHDVLILPFLGTFLPFHSRLRANDPFWIDMDFDRADLLDPELREGELPGPLFERWQLTRLPGKDTARLSIRRRSMTDLAGRLQRGRGMMWIMQSGATQVPGVPTPTPIRPLPSVRPVMIRTPKPAVHATPRPTIIFTPPPATPRPEPTESLYLPVPVVTPPPISPSPTAPPTPRPTPRPPRVIKTVFEGASYDASRQAVVMPFQGQVPAFALRQASATQLYVDFPTARLDGRVAMMQNVEKPSMLASWYAADEPGAGAFRVTLNLTQRGEVLVAYDGAHKQVLLMPQLLSSVEQAPPPPGAAITTVFVRAAFDPHANAVVLPYYGSTPLYVVESVTGTSLYVDFLNSSVTPDGVQYQAVPDFPLMTFWLMAKRPENNIVRVSLTLPFGGHADVLDDQANKRLLLVPQLGPAPGGVPSPTPTPRPRGLFGF